jgi:hypothetical protein
MLSNALVIYFWAFSLLSCQTEYPVRRKTRLKKKSCDLAGCIEG